MSKEKDASKKGSGSIILAIILGILIAAGAGVFTVIILINSKKEYRFVQVESYDGKVNLSRNSKDVEIFEGLMLIPDDKVSTKDDSEIALLVDDDKHIVAAENTVFVITATGDDSNGKVLIKLKSGEGLFTIDNKLKKNSTFEVKTPNAALSVRGTTFRVNYNDDKKETTVEVMEGVVYAETDIENFEILAGDLVIIGEDYIIKNGEAFAGSIIDEGTDVATIDQDAEEDDDTNPENDEEAGGDTEAAPEEGEKTDFPVFSGYVDLEQVDSLFRNQVDEAELTYVMDCILTGQANRKSPVEAMGYNLAHSSFTDGKNKDGSILTLLDTKKGSGEIDFYYDIEEVDRLARLMGTNETISQLFAGNVSDGRFKAVRYTTVQEDSAHTTTKITGIYVENETVYVAADMTMAFYSDPDKYNYKYVAVMEIGADGNYYTVDVIKGTLSDLGY